MSYRDEADTKDIKYRAKTLATRIRDAGWVLGAAMGASVSVLVGLVGGVVPLLVASVIATVAFFIALLVSGDESINDKIRMFSLRPVMAMSSASCLTCLALLLTGNYYETPEPTVEEMRIKTCEAKLEALENVLVNEMGSEKGAHE